MAEAKAQPKASRTAELDAMVQRWLTEMPEDFQARLLDRLDGYPDEQSCWLRTRLRNNQVDLPTALGMLRPSGKTYAVLAHRAVWIHLRGPIPYGLVLDHDDPKVGCHNRLCSNPAHIVVSTQLDNVMLTGTGPTAQNARRTHCQNGHLLTGPDADLLPSGLARGGRQCRRCSHHRHVLIHRAQVALGLQQRDYTKLFGWSGVTAEAVLWAAEACAATAKGGH